MHGPLPSPCVPSTEAHRVSSHGPGLGAGIQSVNKPLTMTRHQGPGSAPGTLRRWCRSAPAWWAGGRWPGGLAPCCRAPCAQPPQSAGPPCTASCLPSMLALSARSAALGGAKGFSTADGRVQLTVAQGSSSHCACKPGHSPHHKDPCLHQARGYPGSSWWVLCSQCLQPAPRQ